jgi:hypothetical protein
MLHHDTFGRHEGSVFATEPKLTNIKKYLLTKTMSWYRYHKKSNRGGCMSTNNKETLPAALWNEIKAQWAGHSWSGEREPIHIRALQKSAVILFASSAAMIVTGIGYTINTAINGRPSLQQNPPMHSTTLDCK